MRTLHQKSSGNLVLSGHTCALFPCNHSIWVKVVLASLHPWATFIFLNCLMDLLLPTQRNIWTKIVLGIAVAKKLWNVYWTAIVSLLKWKWRLNTGKLKVIQFLCNLSWHSKTFSQFTYNSYLTARKRQFPLWDLCCM